jgi:hypothetical protein
MARVSGVVAMAALAGTPLFACGARSWLPVETNTETGDAATCKESDVPQLPKVPNLYFVLDISGSMASGNKWTNVRSAVASLIDQLGSEARFGATVFPAPGGSDQCAGGVEVMPLRLGDSQGATASAFLAATMLTPNGGTPTAATFRSLVPRLRDFPGVTVAILATDGGPNCDPDIATCSIDQCTSNIDGVQRCVAMAPANCCDPTRSSQAGLGCLDSDATAQAVSDLLAAGVSTYVMGIPGSSPYGPVLDRLAIAGGTARAGQPRYYSVNTADESALASAFQAIAAEAMKTCLFVLGRAVANPNKVNVYVDGAITPNGGPNGWSLNGQTVALRGSTCTLIQSASGDTLPQVRVVEGCPTVR